MPKITFISDTGDEMTVDGDVGQSVMHVARRAGIDGIVGECGGCCACGTCHVYVAVAWQSVVGPSDANESEILEFISDRRAGSRLSCQIRIRPELDGLVVQTPAKQG